MKRTNKAFTIVEVIIVIAVIGILAAILILALPKAIEEAHEKSALSDAKNTLTETAIETDPSDKLNKNYIIIVEKYEKEYVFACEDGGEITPYELNPFGQCNRAELADALCDMGLVQAPLGLNEVTLTEQFSSVTLFTGGKLQSPQRIDVEVNCDTDLPECGILNVTWKTDNSSVASIQNGKIHGKAVGKTTLTGMCDDIRIAYNLYVGKRANVSNFDELKAAIEDESESVFIYCKSTVPNGHLIPTFSELPVTIPEGKYAELCGDMGGVLNDSGFEARLIVSYTFNGLSDRPDAVFINDGGIFVLNHSAVCVSAGDMSLPYSGACVVNRGGRFLMCDDAYIKNSDLYVLPQEYIFGLEGTYTDDETAMIKAHTESDSLELLNEAGYADIQQAFFVPHIKNGKNGKMSIVGHELMYIYSLINEGELYSLSNAIIGGTPNICDDLQPLKNSGTIYRIEDTEFSLFYGAKGIVSDGGIRTLKNCRFKGRKCDEKERNELKDNKGFTDTEIDTIFARKCIPLYITGGFVGEISDCEFNCDSIVFDGCTPFSCIRSGKFREKPDDVILYGNSTCIYDEAEEVYIVRIDNGQVTIVN